MESVATGQVGIELLAITIAIGTAFVAWLKHLIDRERKAREEIEAMLKGQIIRLQKELEERRDRQRECYERLDKVSDELAYLRGKIDKLKEKEDGS